MTFDGYRAAWWLHRILRATGGPVPRGDGSRARLAAAFRLAVRSVPALRAVLTRAVLALLAASRTEEHRRIAKEAAAAISVGDHGVALAMAATARRGPDLRAEKVVSRRYGFLWICVPKAASRSLIEALLAVDPGAEIIRGRTLEQIFRDRPAVRGYYSFAFMRHPGRRAFSFYADKHVKLARSPQASADFIEPYHGVRRGMGFAALCRWLNTPYGSDAFADRHWLSQHRQVRLPDGRLPDFVGRFERLDADWEMLSSRLGLPRRPLRRINPGPPDLAADEHLDGGTAALLRRRYAADFRLGGYDA